MIGFFYFYKVAFFEFYINGCVKNISGPNPDGVLIVVSLFSVRAAQHTDAAYDLNMRLLA